MRCGELGVGGKGPRESTGSMSLLYNEAQGNDERSLQDKG